MNNDDFYKKFDSPKNSKNRSNSFVLRTFSSFFSGILGALIVVGIIFFVPAVREKVFYVEDSSPTTQAYSSGIKDTTSSPNFSLTNYSDTSIYAANKALPSIVGITVEYNVTMLGRTQTAEASGSGIIISEDGYILTNNHVISSSDSSSYYQVSEATSVKVSLYNDEEKTYDAQIIGNDSLTDLAVLKIDAENLTSATLGDSSSLKVGEFVLAVGSPLGLQSSVTAGIISALNREITSSNGTEYTVIQADCAINSGNSGGALVNSNGEVIGINTLKLSGSGVEGMGFAIPINSTLDIYKQLIQNGKVVRPYIGISGSTLSNEISARYNLPSGIYVESVEKGSGAETAGIQKGDLIVKVDGTEVTSMQELNKIKNTKAIGDTLNLTIYRAGKTLDLNVKLGEMP